MELPNKMDVIQTSQAGGPEVLMLSTRPLPIPKPNEILIKAIAAGVNGPDLVQRNGLYPPPKDASDLLGLEVSGEVVALGDATSKWQIGDRVCALTNGGSYAQYVAVNELHCLPIPHGVSEIDAAGLPEAFFTVWSNIFYKNPNIDGKKILVHGGSGGIGSTCIQLGAALGLKVFTTANSEESCSFCLELGAFRAINFLDEDFVPILREAGGADIILDIIGGDYVARNIKAARHDARLVLLAFNKGSKIEIDLMPIMLKRLIVTGSTLRSRSEEFKSAIASELIEKVWPLFSIKKLKPKTHKVFNLSAASEAHTLMESGTHRGKIILKVN